MSRSIPFPSFLHLWRPRRWSFVAGVVCLLCFGACERRVAQSTGPETDDPNFRQGQQLARQGRPQEALAEYLKVIARRGDAAPESNLEVGLIYQENIKDPIAAIYYFRRYLELQPNSRQAENVRGLVNNAKREFARTLPAAPLESQTQRIDLVEQIERLQRENDDLKAELTSLRSGGTAPVTRSRFALNEPSPSAPAPSGRSPVVMAPTTIESSPVTLAPEENPTPTLTAPRTDAPVPPTRPGAAQPARSGKRHTIAKGDTLFSLAQRYYGNRSKWRDILAANRDVLANENSPLRIGMELKIP
ncbi:LysM peptidoglycan-binding domain-containing protein [Horticoccus luteus]|uniref:LysM peptidoglycan-binding domain-containing protein n=1 Tax=Horticoccus luteus TaxID=2862869 RepID=A0A8F9XKC1_9BACT|nr:LysM peptidoglycan-binding domain-containing protein [Horticoccus luteus]QYM79553.1 LysM peptidoglycan-binding domain-containing protein [Horticoccus luteus]